MKLSAIALSAVTISRLAAQQLPTADCPFDGFDPQTEKVAEVAVKTTSYFNCGGSQNCIAFPLSPGDSVVIYHNDGSWTCGYLSTHDGSTSGWVLTKDIRTLEADPNPPIKAWVGNWIQRDGRIRISLSKTPGRLSVEGDGAWQGNNGVAHSGDFFGDATPKGNHLHFVQGNADSCAIDLALFGNHLLANDNERCGALNVRFWNVWKRSK